MSKKKLALGAAFALIATAIFLPLAASADNASTAQPNIVGGNPANISDYPFAVYLADSGGNQFCGGTLIGSNSVLTAAHCAKSMSAKEMRVVGGRQNKKTSSGSTVEVSDIWVQSKFKDPNSGNDLAVLTLKKSLPYQAARLPRAGDSSVYSAGSQATVLGWGRIADGGDRSDYLRSANLKMVSDSSCSSTFSNFDSSSMVCAGVAAGGIDACQGDSGGPLVVGDMVIGIVSYGEGCGAPNKPGVYTRVSAFTNEIKSHTN